MTACLYVSASHGIHDERWIAGLGAVGFDPIVLTLGRDAQTVGELRERVAALAGDGRPVLAGPLDSITRHLVDPASADPRIRVTGLSWGYDLHDLSAAHDTAWLPKLSGLIVDSSATRQIALEAGLPDASITMIPWGTDVARFTPEGPVADPQALGLPPRARIVLSLRAHEPLYRVADVIDGFARIAHRYPDVQLVLGHRGSLTHDLIDQATQLGIADRVHALGTMPEADLPALLRAASVYVTASEVDGTSVTLLQAMACGTPVVASANAGNLDWIEPGRTGDLFDVGDVHGLADALATALDRGRGPVTTAARVLVEQQGDWDRNVQRLAGALRP